MLAAVLALAPAASAAERTVPPRFYGANWDAEIQRNASPAVIEREAGRMAATGVETMRTNFEWAFAQREKGGPFDFTRTDVVVQSATAHGIEVLPVVIYAPEWARRYPKREFSPPARPGDYAGYVRALIRRYGPSGTFWAEHPELPARPIRYWQPWNEVHLGFQWNVPPEDDWAKGYGALLRKTYRTVKQADPGARVVLAGLANFSWQYIADLYRRGKVKGSFDVAAVHPYTRKPGGTATIVEKFRTPMRNRGDGKKPIWITELGLPASKGRLDSDSNLQTTDAGMAAFLTGAYRDQVRNWRSRTKGARRVYWYNWASVYCCEIFRFSGLLQYDNEESVEPKPAFDAYLRSAQKYEGCVKDAAGLCQP